MNPRRAVVVGAGPSGLAAAHELAALGCNPIVLEKGTSVGGLARTEEHRGFRFDMGGHRFFTKSAEVQGFWERILGADFVVRKRLSRIYYRGRFFNYPLDVRNAVGGLGLFESVRVALSYAYWRAFPFRREETFEQWVTNRFGRRLFRTFFETYTEKVWGLPCSEIRSEWAAQRIRNLSLARVIASFFRRPGVSVRSLVEEFHYPRLGPGMMWSAVAQAVRAGGGDVRLGADVTRIHRRGTTVTTVELASGEEVGGATFLFSMPVGEWVAKLDPPAPEDVAAAARDLRHRAFLTVCLIVDSKDLFPDNWIYVHDPGVRVARIQNFGNWSPDMVPDPSASSLGLEYFCDEGDDLWTRPDHELIALATEEIGRIGLLKSGRVTEGVVFRVPAAYPIYDATYARHLATIRRFVDGFTNCRMIGRNGLHRYNNQDHAMLTGFAAARSLALGVPADLWSLSDDPEYLEESEPAAGGSRTRRWFRLSPLLKQAAAAILFR
jgi:protoporphyrinogen oxidase